MKLWKKVKQQLWNPVERNYYEYPPKGFENVKPKTYNDIRHDGPRVRRSDPKDIVPKPKAHPPTIIQLSAIRGWNCELQGHRIEPHTSGYKVSQGNIFGFRCKQCGHTWDEMILTPEGSLSLKAEPTK